MGGKEWEEKNEKKKTVFKKICKEKVLFDFVIVKMLPEKFLRN